MGTSTDLEPTASTTQPAQTQNNKPPLFQKFWTEEKILEGIVHGQGIPAEICRWLALRHNRPASKSMFFAWLRSSQHLRDKMQECRSTLFDVCMIGIAARASNGMQSDQRFLAGKLGPEFGWFIKQKDDNATDGRAALQQEAAADGELTDEQIKLLTTDELRKLIAVEDLKDNVRRRQAALSESSGG